MSGQAIVGIGDKEWSVDVATLSWELEQGLGGLAELPAGTGMLFDLGFGQTIQVTTAPMLFSLDIAFFAEDFTITELYQDVAPGYIVTSQIPARYFLEVNAGELAGIEAGSQAEVTISGEGTATAPDWTSMIFGFADFLVMGIFMVVIARDLVNGAFGETEKQPLPYGTGGEKLLAHTTGKSSPPSVTHKDKPAGTCYTDAWRFLIKEGEGELLHGTVYSNNRRIGHAWVETDSGFVWEPQTRRYFTSLGFKCDFAPLEDSRYTLEQAAIMLARTGNFGPGSQEERSRYIDGKSAAAIQKYPVQPAQNDDIALLPDSPEYLAYTIEDIGFREIIDSAFREAISRARGVR